MCVSLSTSEGWVAGGQNPLGKYKFQLKQEVEEVTRRKDKGLGNCFNFFGRTTGVPGVEYK